MIEVITVTVVVGILAAMVVPRFASARDDTTVAAASEDLRTIARAVSLYQGVNGSFPPNASRTKDAENLKEYFKNTSPFVKLCPIGGVYDYDGPSAGKPVSVSIIQDGSNRYTFEFALELDKYMDDGDLGTGRLTEVGNSLRFRFAGSETY